MTKPCDLLIIGGGPAGLSAAINAASEGLDVRLMDAGHALGGQARESSAIENYPGFPEGVTGDALMSSLVRQARKFQTELVNPAKAGYLETIEGGRVRVMAEDYSETIAKVVILALGVSYRRLNAENIGEYLGRGVYYGVPPHAAKRKQKSAIIVGGANSAGQAALNLAKYKNCHVNMLVRRKLDLGMSQYLVDRIKAQANITVWENCEITGCIGDHITVKEVETNQGKMAADAVYIFIGAVPKTLWLKPLLELDSKGFVLTNPELEGGLPYETSLRNVFAAGDVRSGSTKRIAAAIGEGAAALQMIHKRLGET